MTKNFFGDMMISLKILSLFMWRFLFFVLVHLTANDFFYFEGELPTNAKTLIVGLGSGCDTGLTLRDCGLREAAFPFDWVINSNHELSLLLFKEDFANFTEEKYFVKLEIAPDHPNSLLNSCYDIIFHHEGTTCYDWSDLGRYWEQIERMQIKYERRIKRFRSLRNYPGKVFFIRNFNSEPSQAPKHIEMARELREVLDLYFPTLDFTLVIVTYTDVGAPDIKGVNDVIEFKMFRPDWRIEYRKMYQILLKIAE